MYRISRDQVMSQLEKLRQIRQSAGEVIAFLEHLTQLQGEGRTPDSDYNPDDYLEKLAKSEPFGTVANNTYENKGGDKK